MADEFVWSQSLLVLFHPANMLALLYPVDLRSFFTCSKCTSWQNMHAHLSGAIKQIMSYHRQQHEAAKRCNWPTRMWREDFPICSAPGCNAFTGLWIASVDELNRSFGENDTDYMCGSSFWGSLTIRSVLYEGAWEEHGITGAGVFVACCPDCGHLLKEIARIRGQHEHVLLASHVRELPNARSLEVSWGPHWAEYAVPIEHLLLSEMEAQRDRARLWLEAGLRRRLRRRLG